jgi:hypothetical protein
MLEAMLVNYSKIEDGYAFLTGISIFTAQGTARVQS